MGEYSHNDADRCIAAVKMVAWFKFEDPASELAFVSLGDRCETSRNAREMRNEMAEMCKSSQSLVYNTPTTHKKGKAAPLGAFFSAR